MRADAWNRALKHCIRVHNDLPRSAQQYLPNAIMMEVRHQERDGILSGDQEGYEGWMPRLSTLLPQDPYQGDVHRARISEIELMEWYGKRAHVRQSGLSWGVVEEAIVDLLKDKPYTNSSAPRQSRTPTIPRTTTATGKTQDRCNRLRQINPNSYTPIRSYFQSRQSRSFETEQDAHPPTNESGQ